jgi:hypothetical protein
VRRVNRWPALAELRSSWGVPRAGRVPQDLGSARST